MQKYYNIDFLKLMLQALSTDRRKQNFIALFRVIASQIQKVHFDFLEFVRKKEARGYSQKRKLQSLINDWFDPYKRRIILKTIDPNYDHLKLFNEQSNKPKILSETKFFLLQKQNSLLNNEVNFSVVLPAGFALSKAQKSLLEDIISVNKLPSKKYIITNG